jgi:UDP-GlcNAc:undecaprenyl-phosphate GlcNAc-1-phosphate transferase
MILDFALVSSLSFVLSFFAVIFILGISHRMAWYDRTGGRKIHTGNIPRLGGAGFSFAFLVCFSVLSFRFRSGDPALRFFLEAAAFALILIGGIRDDFKPLAPRYKLVLQAGAALCLLLSGHVFERLFFIDGFDLPGLPGKALLCYLLTFLWIVGMTNAINFIDGVDGLAGGVSLLAALSFWVIFVMRGIGGVLPLLCVALVAALLGFLIFNAPFPRAKIFMGDGGAYFLGFTLALLPLLKTGAASFSLPVSYAIAILLIPVLDTTAAVWRRLRDGRRIDSPDRLHTHHKLMDLGLSARRIDALLYGLQICLSILVCIAVRIPGYVSLLILFLAYAVGIGFFTAIHFLNRRKRKTPADTGNNKTIYAGQIGATRSLEAE